MDSSSSPRRTRNYYYYFFFRGGGVVVVICFILIYLFIHLYYLPIYLFFDVASVSDRVEKHHSYFLSVFVIFMSLFAFFLGLHFVLPLRRPLCI